MLKKLLLLTQMRLNKLNENYSKSLTSVGDFF